MSKEVDQRIVRMEFDNHQFEANVKTSMSTLDRLKQSLKLDKASKSFDDINKASANVSFDKISKSVESLEKRFSTLGIVGMRVIENLTDSMMRLGSKATSFITEGIVQGGKRRAMNLENAHFQLQGLLKDEEAVAAIMKNVTDSVDGTAYSLDAAAKVASQLAASGMRAGDSMYASLRGIAGVAAMTNSEYEEIGQIYTKVAGNGRLMGEQLLQLSSRGMNAAAVLGEALGKSEADIRKMVTKGEIDFETFSKAMDDAFGEHAKKANETFTGALSNIKSALARIGALFVAPLVEQNGAIVQLLNAVRVKINDIKNSIAPLADFVVNIIKKIASGLTEFVNKLDVKKPIEKMMSGLIPKWDQFMMKLEDAGISAEDFQSRLTEIAAKHGISVNDLISKYGSLGKVMSAGKISKGIIIETLKSFINTEKTASSAAVDITSKLEMFNNVTRDIIRGNYDNGSERVKELTEAGYEYATMQKLVNYIWERNGHTWNDVSLSADELTKVIGDLSKEELESIGYTEEQAQKLRELAEEAEKTGTPLNELLSNLSKPSGKELIIDSFRNGLIGLKTIITTIKDAWVEMFSGASGGTSAFYNIAEAIHKFSEKLVLSEENVDKLKRTFKGLFAVLDIIRTFIGGAFSIAFRIITAVLGAFDLNILDVTAAVGDFLVKVRDWIKSHDLLGKAIEFLVPIIKKIIEVVYDWGTKAYEWIKNNEKIQNGIEKLASTLRNSASSVRDWFNGLKESDNIPQYIISGLINGLRENAPKVIEFIKEIGQMLIDAIKDVLGIHSPSTVFIAIGAACMSGFLLGLTDNENGILSTLGEFGTKCVDAIKKTFNGISLGKVFALGISASVTYFAFSILGIAKRLTGVAESFGGAAKSVGGFFDTLSKKIGGEKKTKWQEAARALLEFAAAIAILSASVYVLSTIDTKKMWISIGAIGALGAGLLIFMAVLKKIDFTGSGVGKIALMFLSISASILLMAKAMDALSKLSPEALKTGKQCILEFAAIITIMVICSKNASGLGPALLGIAVVVMALTSVMKSLSKMNPSEISKGLKCITLFGLIISALILSAKYAGSASLSGFGVTLIGVSVVLLSMATVMKRLSKLSDGDIKKGLKAITAFMSLITILIAVTQLTGKSTAIKGLGVTLIGISVALLAMVTVVKITSKLSKAEIKKGITCITVFGGIIAALILVSKKAKSKGVASSLLGVSAAIAILAGTAIVLSLIDLEALKKGVIAVSILSACVAGLMVASKHAKSSKGSIIALAVVVGLLGGVVAAFSFIDERKLKSATLALSTVMGMFSIMELAASKSKGSISSIISMSLIVAELAGVLYLLSSIDSKSSYNNALSLSALLLAMSGALLILSKIKSPDPSSLNRLVGSMALLGLVVGELGVILGGLSRLKLDSSINNVKNISVLLGVMSGVLLALQYIKNPSNEAIASLALLGLVVGELGVILGGLSRLNLESSINNVQNISILLGVLTGVLFALQYIEKPSYASIGALAVLGLVIGELGLVLGGLSKLDINISLETATALSELLLAMSVTLGILSLVGDMGSASFIGIGAFATFIAVMGTIIAGFGALQDKVFDLEGFIDKGLPILEKIGTGIGNFVGNIIGGVINGVMSGTGDGLVSFAKKLSEFIDELQPFLDGVSSIDPSTASSAEAIGKTILALTGAELLDAISRWLGAGEKNLEEFAKQLKPFGEGLKEYSDAVNGVDAEAIKSSADAAENLVDLAQQLPRLKGLAQAIAGSKNLGTFGETLIPFGRGLKNYSLIVNGINDEAIKTSADAAGDLVSLAQQLPRLDGALQEITGSKNLATFGETLVPFGRDLKTYSETIDGNIDVEAIKNSADAAGALADVAQQLPALDGWFQQIAGSKDLGTFGEKLIPFGTGIKDYSDKVKNVDTQAIWDSKGAVEALQSVVDVIGKSGGILDFFFGSYDFGNFGYQLSNFGSGIKSYSDAIKNVDAQEIINSKEAIENIAEIIKAYNEKLNGMGGGLNSLYASATAKEILNTLISLLAVSKLLSEHQEINTLKDDLNKMAEALMSFENSFSDLDLTNVAYARIIGDDILELSTILNSIDSSNYSTKLLDISDAITEFYDGLSLIKLGTISDILDDVSLLDSFEVPEIGSKLTESITNGINDSTGIQEAAAGLIDKFKSGIDSDTSVYDTVKTMVSTMESDIKSYRDGFSSAGKYLVDGFIIAIQNGKFRARIAAAALAKAAKDAAQKALDEHSPSKVFYKIGDFVAQGFTNGINENSIKSEMASKSMAKATIDIAKKTLQIASPSRAFAALGRYIGEGLAVGIQSSAHLAVEATGDMVNQLKNVAGMGLEDAKKWIETAKSFDELSLEDEFYIWELLASQYADGTEECIEANKELYRVSKELNQKGFEDSKNWIDREKNYNRLSKEEELAALEKMQQRYAIGSDERDEIDLDIYKLKHEIMSGNVSLIQEEINKQKELAATYAEGSIEQINALKEVEYLESEKAAAMFEDSKSWIDKEKKYGRLSLEEEIAAWERIQARYAEGTKEREEADYELYQLKNDLIEGNLVLIDEEIAKQKQLLETLDATSIEYGEAVKRYDQLMAMRGNARYDNSMDWIQTEEDFDRLGLLQKLAAYKRVQQDTNITLEQRKKIDKTIYDLEKDIYEKEKKYYEDIDDIRNDAHEKRLELEQEWADKRVELQEKCDEECKKLDEDYLNEVESRAKSLYDSYGLFDAVEKKKKVSGNKLMKNLQAQVDEFKDWDSTISELSARGLNEALVEELQAMGPSAIAEIKALNSMSDTELAQYANLWSEKHKEAKNRATDELEGLRVETQNQIGQLKSDLNKDLIELGNTYVTKLEELQVETSKKLDELEQDYKKSVGLLPEYTEEEFSEMVRVATDVLREANWDENGEYIVDGVTSGIENKRETAINSVKQLGVDMVEAFKKTIDSHSPSKVFATLGGFIDQGLVVGIEKYKNNVVDSTSDIANETIDTMKDVVSCISNIVNSDMDFQPSIRPVIDMSDADRGLGLINGAFSSRSMMLGMNVDFGNQNGFKSQINEAISKLSESNMRSNETITNAINELRSDFSDLVDKVTNLQMVVDSGELVGAIAPKMDRSLGRAAVINRRINR